MQAGLLVVNCGRRADGCSVLRIKSERWERLAQMDNWKKQRLRLRGQALFLRQSKTSSDADGRSRSGSPSTSDTGEDGMIGPSPSPGPTDVEDDDEEPSEEIIAAIETLSLSSLRLQATKRLPFLMRTLRRGFEDRCRLAGVRTARRGPPRGITKVVFRRGEWHEYVGKMSAWKCPVCELHGEFANREMLGRHLDWDHEEVRVGWEEVDEVRKPFLLGYQSPDTRDA
jgi:hypothetical protein